MTTFIRFLMLSALIFLAGCSAPTGSMSNTNYQISPASRQTDTGNQNVNSNGNGNLNAAVYTESVMVLDPKACSESNPPRTNFSKGADYALNYCGTETNYSAYEFKKEKLILFTASTWDAKTERHSYSTKLASTQAPYAITTLTDKVENFNFDTPIVLKEKNLYVWYTEASGPGQLVNIFAFRPTDRAFMTYGYDCNGYVCDVDVQLSSSLNPQGFQAVSRNDSKMGECENCVLASTDVMIEVNEKKFTKQEVVEGRAKEVIQVFSCDAVSRYSSAEEQLLQKHFSELLADFPGRFPCWTYPTYDTKKVSGYFDLIKNEYVPN